MCRIWCIWIVYGLCSAVLVFFDFGVQPTKIMGEPTYGGVVSSGGQRVKIIVPKQFYGVILRARWCPHSWPIPNLAEFLNVLLWYVRFFLSLFDRCLCLHLWMLYIGMAWNLASKIANLRGVKWCFSGDLPRQWLFRRTSTPWGSQDLICASRRKIGLELCCLTS